MNDEVDLVERLDRGCERLGLGRIGDGITRAHLGRGRTQRFLTPSGQDDVVSEFDEPAPAGLSDTTATAGDQGVTHAQAFTTV